MKTIPLSRLKTELEETLNECAATVEPVAVELPDQKLLNIQPLESREDDNLTDELLASNPAFQALVEKSKAGLRMPFSAEQP